MPDLAAHQLGHHRRSRSERERGARRERELFDLRDADPYAREELIKRFLPLARSVARRYDRSSEPLEDLVQIASMALVKAVDRYEPSRGHAFSSYAVPTISGEIKRHFRDHGWSVRPPRDLQELTLRIETAMTALSASNDRTPTVAELAENLDLDQEQVLEGLQARGARGALSLHGVAGGAAERTLEQTLGCNEPGYAQAEARELVGGLLAHLPPRTRYVLRLRFEDDLKQSDIAALVGVSQMQISRIIRAAIEQIRVLTGVEAGSDAPPTTGPRTPARARQGFGQEHPGYARAPVKPTGGAMLDDDPRTEGDEQVGIDNARSPAPDAAPEDNPRPDALSGDVDIKSGTERGTPAGDDQRSGTAGPAAGTTEGEDAVGVI